MNQQQQRVVHIGSKKYVYGTECDMCKTMYYSEKRKANKRRFGALNLVCAYCYEWSVPISEKYGNNITFRIMEGTPFKPRTDGKNFSSKWGLYKSIKSRAVGSNSFATIRKL
jgi:hypothetical protein